MSAIELYGDPILGFEYTSKLQVYNLIIEYFGDAILQKNKDVNGYSMYITKNYCLLSKECRYILVFVKQDENPVGTKLNLSNLEWDSIQTRTLPNEPGLPTHNYTPSAQAKINYPIIRSVKNDDSSEYTCNELPIVVTLLDKKNSNYAQKGSIVSAIETYSTVITFSD